MTFDLSSLGWDGTRESQYAAMVRADRWPARVSRVDRGVCTVLGRDGALRASVGGGVLAVAVADPVRLPCAGDWVVVQDWPDRRSTIEAVLPRRTAIIRSSAGAEALAQVLAANVETAAVVAQVDPEPDVGMIERLLTLAWRSGAQPIVVLTKTDLAADPAAIVAQIAEAAPGVPVYAVSGTTGRGISMLRPHVAHGRTMALIGASGSGKSTLVNALAGATVMTTQAIRRSDGRGRHTTTFRALVPLPGGGAILDTPGIRSVGLVGASGEGEWADDGLARAFADVEALAGQCRFNDCSHGGEPGCAVIDALTEGSVSPRRIESWRKLRREAAAEAGRRDARVVAEERLAWRQRRSAARTARP